MTLDALAALWESRADTVAPYSAPAARAFRAAAAELRAVLQAQGDDTVTLSEAAHMGGYSRDHLERLVRAGRLLNVGAKHRPRIRRQDVPRKPGHVEPLPTSTDGGQFAASRRAVVSRITGGTE